MENMGFVSFMKELKRLNPKTRFDLFTDGLAITIIPNCFFRSSLFKIMLPAGYYFSGKNGITNRHNTDSGVYECFELMTKREFRKMKH